LGIKLPPWQNFLVRYGAGISLLTPITKWKYWNVFAWLAIVLGIIGWVVFLYFFPIH
jgi:hypothetical protein